MDASYLVAYTPNKPSTTTHEPRRSSSPRRRTTAGGQSRSSSYRATTASAGRGEKSPCPHPLIRYKYDIIISMPTFSFDIVSDYDKSELNNVVDQSQREITNRYDLKGTKASLDWLDGDKTSLKIIGDNDFHIDAILDIVRKKLATRSQSQKVLDTTKDAVTSNLQITKIVPLKKGLDQDKAKKITSLIREQLPKVKTQIQGDEVRVMSSKKDELQAVMTLLRNQDFDFPLEFTNYRS